MKRRFLAFVCCFGMLASLLPCSAKANERTIKVNLLDTPEEVAEVLDNADDQMMVATQKMDELTYQDPK